MSVAQPSRCLFCKLAPSNSSNSIRFAQRQFHSTPAAHARRKPTFQNIRAVNLGLIDPQSQRPRSLNRSAKTTTKTQSKPADTTDEVYLPESPVPSLDGSEAALTAPTPDGLRILTGPKGSGSIQDNEVRALGREHRRRMQEKHSEMRATTEKEASLFRPYTRREKQLLALKYTSEQLKVLQAAERAIDPRDVVSQGRMRDDPMRVEYKDDYSKILPLIDFPVRAPDEDIDPGIRPLSAEETKARFAERYENLSQRMVEDAKSREGLQERQETLEDLKTGIDAAIYPGDGLTPEQRMVKLREWAQKREGIDDVAEFERFAADPSNFFYSPKGKLHSQSHALSDPIPKLEDPRINTVEESDEPAKERLALQTGLSQEEIDGLRVKILVDHRVVNQTRMGKIQSQYYLSIAGDGNGMLGIGEGKSTEPADGALKSRMNAIRNMRPIPRYEDRTIYGEVEGKVGASIVKLSARPPGFGNRCQSLIFEMARAAGIRDLSARCLRSRNKMNVVKATYEALMSQKLPEDIAKARGRKMVDVRKVYYEGQVH